MKYYMVELSSSTTTTTTTTTTVFIVDILIFRLIC